MTNSHYSRLVTPFFFFLPKHAAQIFKVRTFDLRREDFADQHPRDGTETEGEQHYEHAHGRERNEPYGRNVVIVALHVEKGAD